MTKSTPPPGYEGKSAWGLSPSPPGPAGDSKQALEPLSRRLLQIAGGLSVLLIALVATALLNDDETSLNPIAQAAQRTAAAPGARISFDIDVSSPDEALVLRMRGRGVFSGETNRARARLSFPVGGRRLRIESISDQRMVYVRSAEIAGELPAGRQWLGVKPYLGHNPETALAGGGDLRQQLKLLREAGDEIETVGEQTVRGVATTHYRTTIDLRRVAAKLRRKGKVEFARVVARLAEVGDPRIPVEVWIDEDGVLRRTRTIESLPREGGRSPLKMDMRIELFDFGIEPEIELPPSSEVFDATPLLRAKLGLSGKQRKARAAKAKARRAAKARPTQAATAFRAQLGRVCRETKNEVRGLILKGKRLSEKAARTAAREGRNSPAARRAFEAVSASFHEPLIGLFDQGLDRMRGISAPPGLAPKYRRYVRLATRQVGLMRAMTHAFDAGDFGRARRLNKRVERIGKRLKGLAPALGGGACEDDS